MPYRGLMQALALLILGLAMAGGYWLRGVRADRELAAMRLAFQIERAQAVKAALQAAEQARKEEARRAFEHERIARDASQDLAKARAAATAADGAAGRLREHVARLAAQCAGGPPEDSGAATSGSPAAGPGLVLAHMLGGLEGRGRELAAYADQARIAGQTCERAYDALKPAVASMADSPDQPLAGVTP